MGLRPAKCYRNFQRPYTRQSQRVPKKGYVKGVPGSKVSQYEMGTKGSYDTRVFLVSARNVQIRHNALEAARMAVTKEMEKNIPRGSSFFFKIRVYPHQVLRENAMATGAGADRFQQGMRQSFGNPIGTAARVYAGQRIFEVQVNAASIKIAKDAFKVANHKMPTPCKVEIVTVKAAA